MILRTLLRTLALSPFAVLAFACGGSSDSGQTGDEADVTSCAPATTLTCAKGYVSVTDKCPAGKARCAKDPAGQTCGGIAGLACASGYTCLPATRGPDQTGTCTKITHGGCLMAVCSDEENCDNTGGSWRDDDVNPKTGLFCDCPSGKTWESGKGCVADAPAPTCLTLTCASGYHCCSGPATAPGTKPYPASCQPNGSLCPL